MPAMCSWEALGKAEAQRAALQEAADAAQAGVLAATAQLAGCQAALAEQRKVRHNNSAMCFVIWTAYRNFYGRLQNAASSGLACNIRRK
jgi:aconitase B